MTRAGLLDFASDGRDAYGIAENAFTGVTKALRRDPRFGAVTTSELDLLLADVRADTEQQLVSAMRGRFHVEDIEDLI